jgi:hypothetical protein
MHGSLGEKHGPGSKSCQAFMSQYCSENWDNVCEYASKNKSNVYPNNLQACNGNSDVLCNNLTSGDILIQNTAARKYLVEMIGGCNIKYEQFDPTVATSPIISYWQGGCNSCVPVYAVDPKKIDNDPVMNKILDRPIIAWSILVNIYNTAKRKGTLNKLKGTKIYKFFMSEPFQTYVTKMKLIPGIISNKNSCGCN